MATNSNSASTAFHAPGWAAKAVNARYKPADDASTDPSGSGDADLSVLKNPAPASADAAPLVRERLDPERCLVARSPAMQAIAARARQLAEFDVPVLILGESGCGKEMVARLVHEASNRRHHRFLKVNCAALPDDLLESELFGYEAGAFTGATRAKPGQFEMCQKGTILLDEIGEMSPVLQAKLLHVLQDHCFSRLGGRAEIFADVRVLAATNVDLPKAMAEKRFREDLFFRLNVFSLHLPPLRERPEDIPVLMEHYLQRFAEQLGCPTRMLTPQVLEQCLRHPWYGNVRELENFIKRYLIFGDQAWLDQTRAPLTSEAPGLQRHLPATPEPSAQSLPEEGLKEMVHRITGDLERQTIARVLEENRWNRTVTARVLNISYRALLNKVRQYGLFPNSPERHEKPTLIA